MASLFELVWEITKLMIHLAHFIIQMLNMAVEIILNSIQEHKARKAQQQREMEMEMEKA